MDEPRYPEFEPWTPEQKEFIIGRSSIRLLCGSRRLPEKRPPLLEAALETGARKILYVTFLSGLVQQAREFFRSRDLADTSFHVVAFPNWWLETVHDHCGPEVALTIANGSLDKMGSTVS